MLLGDFLQIILAAEPEVELMTQVAFMHILALLIRNGPAAGRTMETTRATGRLTPTLDDMLAIRAIFHGLKKSELS